MTEKLPKPEEYVSRHKKAFRIAFEYLNAHFPPGDGTEWWEQAAKDAELAGVGTAEREPLATELLVGVYNYLEKEWKRRYADETEH